MVLTVVELKQANKQLETKEKEKAEVKQAVYNASMTKAAESLTARLKDVTHAFCLEVWGQALNATGVDTELKLQALDKVYYPLALCLAPTLPQPPTDPSSAPLSSLAQPSDAPSSTSAKGKDKKKELLAPVDVEAEDEATEVEQLKSWKGRKKTKSWRRKGSRKRSQQPSLVFRLGNTLANFVMGCIANAPFFLIFVPQLFYF